MDSLTPQEIISYISACIVGFIYVAIFWKKLGLVKTLLVILVCFTVDTDHFIFNSRGFREHPADGGVIMHAFHTIELAVLVIGINIAVGYHTIKKGWKTWLFPKMEDYASRWKFSIAWSMRILMIGVFLHYAQDLPIYAIQWKWLYYDYSIIHYLT